MKHLPGNPYDLHEEFTDAMNAAADPLFHQRKSPS